MECFKNGGFVYYNYKNFYSIVLLVVCDVKYCFILVDIGSYGRENDVVIFFEFVFEKFFDSGLLGLCLLLFRLVGNFRLFYVLIGDEIFLLKLWFMKFYLGRNLDELCWVYNYRFLRVRRIIENIYGILLVRWCIFRVLICVNVEIVELIIKVINCFYNYFKFIDNVFYVLSGFVDSENVDGSFSFGDWRVIV